MEIVTLVAFVIIVTGFLLVNISEDLAMMEGRRFYATRWVGYSTGGLLLVGVIFDEPASLSSGMLLGFLWTVLSLAVLAMYVVDITLMNPRSVNSFNHEGL